MIKILNMAISKVDGDDQDILEISINSDILLDWCLSLCLLERNMVDSVVVVDKKLDFKMKIKHGDTNQLRSIIWKPGQLELTISLQELRSWTFFFLKYYRDNVGDVDHIDVDIPSINSNISKGLFLILKVPLALPPVSAEEARRRLGM